MSLKLLALAAVLLPSVALAQTLPTPNFAGVKFNGTLVTGVGTSAGTLAAGNDSRIVGAVQAAGGDASATNVTATGGSASRTAADRAADRRNVKDFGAKMDGSTDDTSAFGATRSGVPANGVVTVPPGAVFISAAPTGGVTTPVLWQMSGNAYAGGSNPVTGMGYDWVESFLGNSGGKYIGRAATKPDSPPVLRVAETVTHTGGTAGFVMPGIQASCVIPSSGGDLNDYVWCNQAQLTSYATGVGQHVAVASRALRPSDALADGRGPRSVIWGGYDEATDQTNVAANLAGPLVGRELDIFANGGDPNNQRIGLDLEFSRANTGGAAARIGTGISISSFNDGGALSSRSYVGRGYTLAMPFDVAGFDTSQALSIGSAPAYRMGALQSVDFTGDGTHTLFSDGSKWYFNHASTTLLTVADSGAVQAGPALINSSGVAYGVTGSTGVGFDTNGSTLTGAAFRMGAGQAIAFEGTSAYTAKYLNGAVRLQNGGTDIAAFDGAGNATFSGVIIKKLASIPSSGPGAGLFAEYVVPANLTTPAGTSGTCSKIAMAGTSSSYVIETASVGSGC